MKNNTLYRCDGYNEEICKDCPMGEPHKFDDACCGEGDKCGKINNQFCACIEYDQDSQCNTGEGFRNQEEK